MLISAATPDALNKYLLIKQDVLPALAREQAQALQGMKPRVTVWSTGQGSDFSRAVTDLFKTGVPLFDGIQQQTGYDFLGSLGIKNTKQ